MDVALGMKNANKYIYINTNFSIKRIGAFIGIGRRRRIVIIYVKKHKPIIPRAFLSFGFFPEINNWQQRKLRSKNASHSFLVRFQATQPVGRF